ncbi:hypothetical protein [Rhizobium laguerreae]|uniref:hypothetical protein n=1 Tax=Rhizobium laguerreae TaxID=1076926 RepID=UPI001C91F73E|nr:hypothetical protein [Rhizobium laguerreae]MBY3387608.1 hypothetical protein [Rhizobium laguerreae]MBY3401358.1 hypothetical protein [Rhizobium laguerreae]MBY3408296.1 hypothetical protein [Rhizobium laguerreae]
MTKTQVKSLRKTPKGELHLRLPSRKNRSSLLFAPKDFIARQLGEDSGDFKCDMSAALTLGLAESSELLWFKARMEDFWPLLSLSEKQIVVKHQPRFASWLEEGTEREIDVRLTFETFKSGPAGDLCNRAGLYLDEVASWSGFANHFQSQNKATDGELVERLMKLPVSSGEASVVQAILCAADYSHFSDELANDRAWDRLSRVYDEHAEAVAAAILRRN